MRYAVLSLSCLSLAFAWDCSSSSIPYPDVVGAKILSLDAQYYADHDGLDTPICEVNVTLTHPGTNDKVLNTVWLPYNWNGRFQGVGGGGYASGSITNLIPAVQANYSAATTDGGHAEDTNLADSWALVSEGNVNQYILLDFASRSIHDMTVIGKAVTASFYGTPANYSYWNGCSTGGRQGLKEAQMYPNDYDGIVANAPAVNWNEFSLAQQWPNVVLNNAPEVPEQCDFDFVNAQAIQTCDALDGLIDGLIGAPGLCLEQFDLYSLVGQTYNCDSSGATKVFANSTARIVQSIWQGPVDTLGNFLWYGILPGTNFSTLANTTTTSGKTVPVSFQISDSWIRNFLYKDVDHPTNNISYSEFDRLFYQSLDEYSSVLETSNPDLSAFRAHGGKIITWQGLADNLIMPNGTMRYYDAVTNASTNVTDFYRLFFSPGVGHCGGGPGPVPVDDLGALVKWVEEGIAPDVLLAASPYPINGTERYQNLCPYPMVSKYNGSGNPDNADAYTCVADF